MTGNIAVFLALGAAAFLLLSFCVYVWAKLGTVAVLRGRQFFEEMQKRRRDDDGDERKEEA